MKIVETGRGLEAEVTVHLPQGLHSRPSAQLARLARDYGADIQIITEDGEVDAKSMLDILSLCLGHSARVLLRASGADARDAITAIGSMLTAETEWPAQS